MTEPFKIYSMPDFTRDMFASDEEFERAVSTSRSRSHEAAGAVLRVPRSKVVDVLYCLVLDARAVGLGVKHDRDPDYGEIQGLVMDAISCNEQMLHFDYVHGRPIKALFHQDGDTHYTLNTALYNRDQGDGKGEAIVLSVLTGARTAP